MKKWTCPTITILSAQILSEIISVHARSIKCELCHVR